MSKKVRRPLKKVIVIGGSQGAIEALLRIVPSFPADLSAAILIVVHMPVDSVSILPKVLSRAGSLKACHPKDREILRPGNIYVAPPNYHLTLEGRTICRSKGPRENRHRPAIDPLFRTAARSFGLGVIAILLSGNLDDGSAGIFAVRKLGGIAIVQDPASAQAAGMPQSALDYAGANFVLLPGQIGPKVTELINSREKKMKGNKKSKAKKNDPEVRVNEEVSYTGQSAGRPSVFACPECHGILWEIKNGKITRYRCRVGHAYTSASLKVEMDQSTERALWAAMRALEERAALSQRVINNPKGSHAYSHRFREQVNDDTANARLIRKMIFASDDQSS
jgi:two-component system, chemotaxis family, protein-glutamate methylesterase/glutaminase